MSNPRSGLVHASIVAFVLWTVSLQAAPATAQPAHASAYRPALLRSPGFVIASYEAGTNATLDVPAAPGIRVRGRYWEVRYALVGRADTVDPREIFHNHVDPLVERGGAIVADAVGPAGGTGAAYLPIDDGKVWVEVRIDPDCEGYTLRIVEDAAQAEATFSDDDLTMAFAIAMATAPYDINFDAGAATIRPESAQALAAVGDLLRNQPSLAIEIQGHTDLVETAVDDRRLSQARADAVKDYLVKTFAIGPERLTAVGFGGTQPLAYTAVWQDAQAKNRRVELVRR